MPFWLEFKRRRRLYGVGALLVLPLIAIGVAGCCIISMPGRTYKGPLAPLTAEEALVRDGLRSHVETLAGTIGDRNAGRYEALMQAAEYIRMSWKALAYTVNEQTFTVYQTASKSDGKQVRNLEIELPGTRTPAEILIIGAHYDSAPRCPAANDNASGVAALLEIARLLAGRPMARTVRLVAFTNEEPPFFLSEGMGSYVYAKRSRERGERIIGMLSLETIGYYSDAPGSQHYPFPINCFYPDTGDFIGFVGNTGSRGLVRSTVRTFRRQARFPSEGIAAPAGIPGIGWSDHWSFWQFDYPGLMVTDTAPFRFPYYHTVEDTPEKLDYDRTARVVAGLARTIEDLANAP